MKNLTPAFIFIAIPICFLAGYDNPSENSAVTFQYGKIQPAPVALTLTASKREQASMDALTEIFATVCGGIKSNKNADKYTEKTGEQARLDTKHEISRRYLAGHAVEEDRKAVDRGKT